MALHVVIGAGGGIGGAVVRELAERGEEVRAVGRGPIAELPPGAEPVAADAADPDAARAACAGAAVVYHCAQPAYTRWPQDFPPLTESIVAATAAAGAKLVFADNLYAYAPPAAGERLSEDSPVAPSGRKGRVRAAVAAALLDAHRGRRLRVTIGRASDVYGPGGRNSSLGDVLFGAAVAGKRPRWLGSLDVPHSEHYLGDVARGLVTLALDDRADGEVWHLPAAGPLNGREFAALIAQASGNGKPPAATSPALLRLGGIVSPLLRELRETAYQWTAPFVIDASRFEAAFGPAVTTPHPEAVAETVGWFADHRRET